MKCAYVSTKNKYYGVKKKENITVLTRQHAIVVKETTSSCCYSDI